MSNVNVPEVTYQDSIKRPCRILQNAKLLLTTNQRHDGEKQQHLQLYMDNK